jgi:hypothetical protein
MLANADVMAFVATADLGRARGFYEGVLGLPVIEDDGLALAFDAHGTMLRVTGVLELTPPPYTVLGWSVPTSPPPSAISRRAAWPSRVTPASS